MTELLSTTRGQQGLPRWFASVFDVVERIETGSLTFVLPDGRSFKAQGTRPGPEGVVLVRDATVFSRLIRDGEMGFAEAYMDGAWDSPDLQAVLDVALMNNEVIARPFAGAGLVRMIARLRHWMNRNTKSGSKRNIAAHYDLGNPFYSRWLDESMTYSSALFSGTQESLEAAQRNKYAAICDAIGAPEGGHVLEIGCGWGGFAEYAAGTRGLNVTALTISQAQHDFAKERIFKAGLADKVDVVIRDYRDERGTYDGVASIEMFEAVGEKFWPVYFGALHDRLKPDARASLQIITIHDRLFDGYRKGVDFVQKYIFPGGMLPSPSALSDQVRRAGLEAVGSIEFGDSYSETLRRWRDRFEDAWHEIAPMGFDDRFRRMWNFYLASCAACFMAGTTDVTQVTLRRPA
ncbi:cyclopropane-fatty-acyl-phospholipid synthase [Albimonas sp. CAU 1670]|uniref:SAM-dependent methyltransferase n=1 Tax=Albimonas sp. CAU 1670 TaxID=3032599 RepID=UPI0023D9C4E4|nr:cyclopropane-fatty-acyl-phospholipid synthase family protein [Albimonas sp. CAU 1670]MDF2231610.1 cyclopropane-fatty-acyl-phospholipid synthase [Albimonas sp. CAU 1670]